MKIKTCEEYVLSELDAALEREKILMNENERLDSENKTLLEQLEAKKAGKELIVEMAARKKLFDYCVSSYEDVVDGDGVVPFADWCVDAVKDYAIPKGVSRSEFIEMFKDELRALYDKKVAEIEDEL